jgi:hypothetical protein
MLNLRTAPRAATIVCSCCIASGGPAIIVKATFENVSPLPSTM